MKMNPVSGRLIRPLPVNNKMSCKMTKPDTEVKKPPYNKNLLDPLLQMHSIKS